MQQTNPWDNDAVVSVGGGMVITKPAEPGRQYAGAQAAANLQHQQLENAKLAREAAAQQDAPVDPAAISFMAQQVLAGGQMPALGMGKQAAAARQAVMAEVARQAGARGLNGADLATQVAHYKAGTKQIGNLENMAGTIGVNEQTALANGQQFLDRSRELPGQTRFAPLNAISDWVQRRFGGTTISAADAAYNTFVNEYAKVVAGSPSGAGTLSDSARHEAMSTINGSGSVDQKQAAFDQMKTDMANRMAAIHNGITGTYKGLTQQPGYQVPADTAGLVLQAAQGNQGVAGAGGGSAGPGGVSSGGGGTPPSNGGPDGGVATGATRNVRFPEREAEVSAAIRSMMPPDEIARRYPGTDPQVVAQVQAGLRSNPNYAFNVLSQREVPTTAAERIGGTLGLGSPVGAFAASANNALTAGLSGKITGTGDVLKNLAAANPTASLLGDIAGGAGGAALTGMGLGAIAGGVGGMFGRALANPITADAVYGGVTGANMADDPTTGALAGAALGAGGGFLGQGIGRMFAGRGPGALNTGENLLANRARQLGPSNITDQLSEAQRLGVPMSLADTGAQMATLGGQVVRRSPDAAQIAQDAFGARARGQIDRLGQAVDTNLGPVGNIPQISADLLQQARTKAGPLYDAAYAQPGAGAIYPQLEPFLNRPSVQSALGRANRIAAEEGRDPTSLGFDLGPNGETTLSRVPSWQTLDYVKRGLDDTVDAARDATTKRLNTEGNAINGTRMDFLKAVDSGNPIYADARRAYAGPMEATNALQAGQDAFSANPGQLAFDVKNAAPGNLPQMQLGYRSALMDKANGVRYASNPFDATLGTPAAEQRLATMYPDNPGNANLLRTRDLEGQLARTNNTVLGNSLTAARQVADADFTANPLIEAGLHGAAAMATGGATLPGTAARIAGLGLKDRIALGIGNRAVTKADQLAPYLFNANPAEATDALTALLARQNAYRDYINNSTARRAGGMFGAGAGVGLLGGQ